MHANGFAVGDSIGVVYQKDNPENNMTVLNIMMAVVWFGHNIRPRCCDCSGTIPVAKKSIENTTRAARSWMALEGVVFNRTDKEYIFVTVYKCHCEYSD